MMHANTHGNCVLEGVGGVRGVRGVRAHSAFKTDALARTHSCTQVVCPGNVDEFTIAKLGEPMPFTSAGCFENEFYVGFFLRRNPASLAVCCVQRVFVCMCVCFVFERFKPMLGADDAEIISVLSACDRFFSRPLGCCIVSRT